MKNKEAEAACVLSEKENKAEKPLKIHTLFEKSSSPVLWLCCFLQQKRPGDGDVSKKSKRDFAECWNM